MSRNLPARPNLEFLKKEAKSLLDVSGRGHARGVREVQRAALCDARPCGAGHRIPVAGPASISTALSRSTSGYSPAHGVCAAGAGHPVAATGFYLSIRDPFFGIVGGLASGLAAVWFVYCGVRAYAAIRRRAIDDHRAWMLRAMAIAYGIAVIRAIDLIVLALFPVRMTDIGGASFWAGFLVSTLAAEWWIHRTAKPQTRALKWAS